MKITTVPEYLNAIETGNLSGDPFRHDDPEVRVVRTKVLADPNPQLVALTQNLALIPGLL